MLSQTNEKVIAALKTLLAEPAVENARALEKTLSDLGFEKKVFGRFESKVVDRGCVGERSRNRRTAGQRV